MRVLMRVPVGEYKQFEVETTKVPGLVVHHRVSGAPGWDVSHFISGTKVNHWPFRVKQFAVAFAEEMLAPIADWQRPALELNTPDLRKQVLEAEITFMHEREVPLGEELRIKREEARAKRAAERERAEAAGVE